MSATILEFRRKDVPQASEFVDQLTLIQRQRITRVARQQPAKSSEPTGAYGMPIIAGKNAIPVHTAGRYIDALHNIRVAKGEFIRYECPALALVVYVYPACDDQGNELEGYRVQSFDFKNTGPTQDLYVKDVADMVLCLQGVLATTLKRVRDRYDLSELQQNEIALISKGFDSIELPTETVRC